MSPTVKGVFCVVLGALFLSLPVIRVLVNQITGRRMLAGRVTAVDQKTMTVHIRYRIAKSRYHECDRKAQSAFLPQPGLKVTVTVYRDDPYNPVSVLLGTKLVRGSPSGYANMTMLLTVIRCGILGLFLILGGVLFLTGEIG